MSISIIGYAISFKFTTSSTQYPLYNLLHLVSIGTVELTATSKSELLKCYFRVWYQHYPIDFFSINSEQDRELPKLNFLIYVIRE